MGQLFLMISHRVSVSFCLALREVAEFVAGQALTVDVDTVIFTQQFPRCIFSTPHYDFLIPIPKNPKGNNFPHQTSPGPSVILG